jgi:hypothetical protein
MNCTYHAEVPNAAFCIRCGKPLCAECVRNVRGAVYCEPCLGELVEGKTAYSGSAPAGNQKEQIIGGTSPGAAFALGLIPGVGAIYNAEYFKAAVHIVIFGVLIGIVESVRGAGEALFGMLTFGFYVYMPFEAYYTAKKRKLKAEGIDLETPFDQFNEQIASIKDREFWGGVLLIVIGALFLLDNFDVLRMDQIFRFWPIVLIAAGIWLLKRFQDKEKAV